MKITFDILQAAAWSITYCLIIVYHVKKRSLGIPPIAIASNFAWETVAFARDIFVCHTLSGIHIAWISLDIILVATYMKHCKPVYLKRKAYFWILFAIEILVLSHIFQVDSGMLISCFVIDLTMAVEYFIYSLRKKIYQCTLSVLFCSAKLLGDLFALLYYMQYSEIVLIIGIIVLLLNIGCLIFLIKKPARMKDNKAIG